MTSKTIEWATVSYTGEGNGTIVISADANPLHSERSLDLTVRSLTGGIERAITVRQAAKPYIDLSAAVVTASAQTYDGSAKTSAPTVTLNGEVVDSSNYDVAYSNNTNAGNATITVTGKGDYTGTASGTFTINKASISPTVSMNGWTYGGTASNPSVSGNTGGGTVTYLYKVSTAANSTYTSTKPTNAGTYTVKAVIAETTNYNGAEVTKNFTISKANRTVSFSSPTTVVDINGTVTNVATVSAGASDGTLTYSSSNTGVATVNGSGVVTGKANGSATITASISAGTNYNAASATYTITCMALVNDFAYTGTVQEITLPAGKYKLQCWGAQGGTNAAYSAYGITANAGGKGGYSEGILTLSSARTLYVFVGGQGGASGNGGWNGGGGSSGESSYDSGGEFGCSRFACGGGATDIALTTSSMSYNSSTKRTDRSSASLLSRIIVAGGGSGGSGGYQRLTTTTTEYVTVASGTIQSIKNSSSDDQFIYKLESYTVGKKYRLTLNGVSLKDGVHWEGYSSYKWIGTYSSGTVVTLPSAGSTRLFLSGHVNSWSGTYVLEEVIENTSTVTDSKNHAGYAGGGTLGDGPIPGYQKSSESSYAGFGYAVSSLVTTTRYVPGGGGGGWRGGGAGSSDSNFDRCIQSGGGSGFVNTAANAGSRPSGYTGLQLDSGSTTAGTSSFPAPGGGNETGHAGNGYARITRLS